jgi:hypothetical protein
MKELAILLMLAGSWKGSSVLYLPDVKPDSCVSTINAVSVLGERFVRMDYTWQYQGTPQEGSLLVGCDKAQTKAVASWIDSWHMGRGILSLKGIIDSTGTIKVSGTWPAPPGPDWGWRIELTPTEKSLHLVMYNIKPDGEEFLAVDGKYEKQ